MKNIFRISMVAWFLLASLPAAWAQKAANDSSRWEKDIVAYEAQDRANPRPKKE